MSCTKRQSKFNFLDPLILTCATDATKIQVARDRKSECKLKQPKRPCSSFPPDSVPVMTGPLSNC